MATEQPRCPECGRFCGQVQRYAGPSVVWRPSCLNCGLNPPRCCFEDGSVLGCKNNATHEVPGQTYQRLWCGDHAPGDAEPLPYAATAQT